MRSLVIIALTFVVMGCSTGLPTQSVTAKLKKPQDSIGGTTTEKSTMVSVTSESGIGSAKLGRIGKY